MGLCCWRSIASRPATWRWPRSRGTQELLAALEVDPAIRLNALSRCLRYPSEMGMELGSRLRDTRCA